MQRVFLPGGSAPRQAWTRATRRCTALPAALALALVLLPVQLAGQASKLPPPNQPKIDSLVTDLDDFALSPSFGHSTSYSINQAGDFVFSPDNSALFVRRAGSSVVPLLWAADPAPGFPDTRGDSISGFVINASGQVAFGMDFFPRLGLIRRGIYVHDSAGFHLIADSADTAPDSGGRPFGRSLALAGFNDAGQVGLIAGLVKVTGTQPGAPTLFLTRVGGTPVRIAGEGDPAPDTNGGTLSSIGSSGITAAGDLLFTAIVRGGKGGRGLFMGSTSGVRKVVSHGDPLPPPFSGTFNFLSGLPGRFLNRSGQVVFVYQGRIYLQTQGGGLSAVVRINDPITNLPGVTINGVNGMLAFNDAGHVALTASLNGTGANYSLLRYTPASGLELVAMRSKPAPEAGGAWFDTFGGASLNADGLMTFQSSLQGGAITRGFFQQASGEAASKVVLEGDATPLGGGGTFGLALANGTTTLGDGSVAFCADVFDGKAYAGTFLALPDGRISSLTSSEDPLPAGSRVSLHNFNVGVGGDAAFFWAARMGGQPSLWLYDMLTRRKTRVAADGDPIPIPGATGRLRLAIAGIAPAINSAGDIVLGARWVGVGPAYGGYVAFWRSRAGDIQKIVAQGDVDPVTLRTFTNIGWYDSPDTLNGSGRLVFHATLAGTTPPVNLPGLFVGAAGSSPVKVALYNESAGLPGTTFSSFGWRAINNAGQVAFAATAADGRQAFYLASPDDAYAPAKIVASLDPGPEGGTFPWAMPTRFAFDDRGEIAFVTWIDGGPGGVFVGTPDALVPVALAGDAAPSGGNFLIDSQNASLHLNAVGDLVFRTALTGGSADSGLFVLRQADGAVRTIALQGQAAPGGGVFSTFAPSINNVPGENCLLTAGGAGWASSYVVTSGDEYVYTFFRLTTANALERVFARGDKAPQSNGGDLLGVTQVYGGGVDASGRYYFHGAIAGKKVSSAIYVTR
jgi:hypothetical protein